MIRTMGTYFSDFSVSLTVSISGMHLHMLYLWLHGKERLSIVIGLLTSKLKDNIDSHLPLSLSPADGTLSLELSHVCACISLLEEIGGRVRAGSAGEHESQSTLCCTRTRTNQRGSSMSQIA